MSSWHAHIDNHVHEIFRQGKEKQVPMFFHISFVNSDEFFFDPPNPPPKKTCSYLHCNAWKKMDFNQV